MTEEETLIFNGYSLKTKEQNQESNMYFHLGENSKALKISKSVSTKFALIYFSSLIGDAYSFKFPLCNIHFCMTRCASITL